MIASEKSFGTGTEFFAAGALLGSKVRADFDYFYPISFCFVGDELLQLAEAPSMEPEVKPLSFSGFSYSFKVFQDDCSCIAVFHDLFADYVVPVSFETFFSAANLLEKFCCRAGAFALELCSQSLEFEPVIFDFVSSEELFVAGYSYVIDSHINSEFSIIGVFYPDFFRKRDVEEHSAFLIENKQSGLVRPVKVLGVVIRDLNRNINSAVNSCKPDILFRKSEGSFVKSKRQMLLKNRLRAFISPDRLKGLRSDSVSVYDELRRQAKKLSGFIITQVMKVIPSVSFSFKSFISNVRNSFAVLFHSIKKRLVSGNFQLNSNTGFHNNRESKLIYILHTSMSSEKTRIFSSRKNRNIFKMSSANSEKTEKLTEGQFLPQLKLWVSLPYLL